MDRSQILNTIESLAMSQGFYGRLLMDIHEDESILDEMEAQNFSDPVDMVMWLES